MVEIRREIQEQVDTHQQFDRLQSLLEGKKQRTIFSKGSKLKLRSYRDYQTQQPRIEVVWDSFDKNKKSGSYEVYIIGNEGLVIVVITKWETSTTGISIELCGSVHIKDLPPGEANKFQIKVKDLRESVENAIKEESEGDKLDWYSTEDREDIR